MDASKKMDDRINNQLGTQLESLSGQIQTNLQRGQNAWSKWSAILKDKGSEFGTNADRFAREKPWPLVGVAMVIGLAAGMCVGRK